MNAIEEGYDPAKFDADYYNRILTGGNPRGYRWDDLQQQDQLAYKWNEARMLGPDIKRVFFVGCACGYEVRYWRESGVEAFGMDVSEWAVNNADVTIKEYIYRHTGGKFQVPQRGQAPDRIFDSVLAFDVLYLVPIPQRLELIGEMTRTADRSILVRTRVRPYDRSAKVIDGTDGVPYRLETIGWWIRVFGPEFGFANIITYNRAEGPEHVIAFRRLE